MKHTLWKCSLGELADCLARRDISAVELLDHYLDRLGRYDPVLNTVIALNPSARKAAEASDERRRKGMSLGMLDGIPFTVKDNILTSDLPTRWGSRVYANEGPGPDEECVRRLKAAGAIVMGKTNVPEFTLEGFTDNPLFGPTKNPWDKTKTPGGSSGGAVAGVAAGLAPFALGTDGGGSIRRPCGYTGLFGLKPSIGRIPRTETLPQILSDMEVVGPISRDVDGLITVFETIAGMCLTDPRSCLAPEICDYDGPGKKLKILYVPRLGDAPVAPEVLVSTGKIATRFEEMGHDVTQGDMPIDIGFLTEAWPMIGRAGLGFLARQVGGRFERASEKYRAMADDGTQLSSATLFGIFDAIANLRRAAAAVFNQWDVILMPSSASMPWAIGLDYPPQIDGTAVGPRGHAVYTGWVNAIGCPALNLPGPQGTNGLPVGSQIIAGFNRDRFVLRLAKHYETAYPAPGLWPALVNDQGME